MKKFFVCVTLLLAAGIGAIHAFDIKDLLSKGTDLLGSNAGTALGGVVEGLFTKSDISVADMKGTWTATGSAVSFQSENALKKAGGSAVSSTIESKIDPYYKKMGLTGSTLTINEDGSFALKVKGTSLKGTVTKTDDGNFNFNFSAFGKVKIGTIKAYVEKTLSGLDVMFDANKLKQLLTQLGGIVGSSAVSSITGILGSYDGLYVGFHYKK